MICYAPTFNTFTISTVAGLSDNKGSSYVSSTFATSSYGGSIDFIAGQIWYALNISSGITSITSTLSTVVSSTALMCHEVSGIATSNAVDVQAANASTTGSLQYVASTTTTNANDYLFAGTVADDSNPKQTAQFPFIKQTTGTLTAWGTFDSSTTVVTTISNISTSTDAANWVANFMAFEAASTSSVPAITYFTASPSSITSGQSATLSWNIATSSNPAISASIDNGIGSVSTSTGSTSVSPTITTTYTLSANNANGTTTATTTVTVSPPAMATFLTKGMSLILKGLSLIIKG